MTAEKNKITIYDVADEAGVAISTVSRVLNNSPEVSDATRAKVQAAIEALQFRPDRLAKTLAQAQSHLVAIAVPTFTTPFHNELLKGVRGCLVAYDDLDLLLCDLGSVNRHRSLRSFLKRGSVDALLLAGLEVDESLAVELAALRAPVVLIGAQWPTFDSYYWDDLPGSKAAVSHLIEQGHTRIGMIRAQSDSALQNTRIEGYRQALEAAGLAYDPILVTSGNTNKHAGFSEEAGFEAMQHLLQIEPRVTAVFASSDVQAIGASKAIREAQLKIPDDIALVGYDDIKASYYLGLTSVDQNMQDIGRRATERLLQRLFEGSDEPPCSELVETSLRVRRSSSKARQG